MPDDFDVHDHPKVGARQLLDLPGTGDQSAQWIPVKAIGIDPSTAKRIFGALKKGRNTATTKLINVLSIR
jgi:hypothetical protein